MILYVNGDSNSAGHGKFWVNKLCSAYDATCINHAIEGGSNPRVLRTVREFISQPENLTSDLFMIIGWTSWEREEWMWNDQYFQINASGISHVPEPLSNRYKQWVADSKSISQIDKSRQLHKQIYDLHALLKKMQIKHLFFNALMPFQHEVLWQSDARYDWTNNFLCPYDNDLSYYWFLKKQGFQPDNHNHYDQTAQEAWGDLLINYIQTNGVLI